MNENIYNRTHDPKLKTKIQNKIEIKSSEVLVKVLANQSLKFYEIFLQ